jgi:hypothetical protein
VESEPTEDISDRKSKENLWMNPKETRDCRNQECREKQTQKEGKKAQEF